MTNLLNNAFPEDLYSSSDVRFGQAPGLTKRQYFAIRCLEGILTNPESIEWTKEAVVKMSVEFADLLIAELNKD